MTVKRKPRQLPLPGFDLYPDGKIKSIRGKNADEINKVFKVSRKASGRNGKKA